MLRKLLVALGASLVLALCPSLAFAEDTGGGSGLGSGTGHNFSNAHGAYAAGWGNFDANALVLWSKHFWYGELRKMRATLEDECKKSSAIFYTSAVNRGRRMWAYNWNGSKYLAWDKIEDVPYKYGGTPTQSQIDAAYKVLEIDGNLSVYNRVGTPSVSIVCTYRGEKATKWIKEYSNGDGVESFEKVLPYSYMTTINPLRIDGKYVGNTQWESQAPVIKKTEFGKLYDQLASRKDVLKSDEIEKLVNEAVAKDANIDYSTAVELSNKNKEAFAHGGVLNISEYTQYAKIQAVSKYTAQKERSCKWELDGTTGKPVKQLECTDWKETGRTYNNSVNKELRVPYQSGFWQMLSVHCNKEGLAKLLASVDDATVVSKDDSDGKFSAVVKSKYYKGDGNAPAQPAKLDFGQYGSLTGSMGFFDKECPFACSPDNKNAKEAKNNLGVNGSDDSSMLYGADLKADGDKVIRGNNFSLFRDNKAHRLHLDLWTPMATKDIHYNGESPITTTVSRWANGTPDVVDTKGGKFSMMAKDGTELFTGKTGNTPTQLNWDTTPFASTTTTILQGAHNEFDIKGSWASEDKLPNVLRVRWEYAPDVSTVFATKLGNSRTGDKLGGLIAEEIKDTTTPVEGKCYARFGNNSYPDTTKEFYDNTGTGTTNNIDKVDVDDGLFANNPLNIVVKFVRATSE